MKRSLQVLFVSLVLGCSGLNAQNILFSEDFESGIGAWTNVTLATDGGWKGGTGVGLSSQSFGIPNHTLIAATNDDGCNCNKSDDYFISPVLDLLTGVVGSSVWMKFDLYYFAGTYQAKTEQLKIKVRTFGGSWTDLATVSSSNWETKYYDLSAYAGIPVVEVALWYNDGTGWLFGAAIDNFVVFEPASIDGSVTNIVTLDPLTKSQGPFTIEGTFVNYSASAITDMTLNYSIDSGTAVTDVLTGLNIAPFTQYEFAHSTDWDITASTAGTHNIDVWATGINFSVDVNAANDHFDKDVELFESGTDRVVLFESFTSSTCGPCASYNPGMDNNITHSATYAVNTVGSQVAMVKYQMNWPSPGTDPNYNADGAARQSFYGVNGIPDPYLNGIGYDDNTAGPHTQLLENIALKAIMDVEVNTTIEDLEITVDVVVDPLLNNIGIGNKLFIAVVEETVNHTTQTNGETEFYFVTRKMLPNGNGVTVGNLVANTPLTFSQSYTFTDRAVTAGSFNLWNEIANIKVIAWVQNSTTKKMHQAGISTITNVTGINEPEHGYSVGVYPNPVRENTTIRFELEGVKRVQVDVFNMLGEKVMAEDFGILPAGTSNKIVNSRNLENGMYLFSFSINDQVSTKRVLVNK